jgi:hypothetical protein
MLILKWNSFQVGFVRNRCKLRVFEKMTLITFVGPKRVKVSGGWRELHNERLSSPGVYYWCSQIKVSNISRYVTCVEDVRRAQKILVTKPKRW